MDKEIFVAILMVVGGNIVMAYIGTYSFLNHEMFYSRVPLLFLLILMFLMWITTACPNLVKDILEEYE